MFPWWDFSVPLAGLTVVLSLLPIVDWKVASFVTAKEHQPPLGCLLASPRSKLRRPRQTSVIEFLKGSTGAACADSEFVLGLPHAQPDEAVIDAGVTVD